MAYDVLLRDTTEVIRLLEEETPIEKDDILSLLKCLKLAVEDLRRYLPSEKKWMPEEEDAPPVSGDRRRHNSDRLGGVGLPL